MTNRNALLFIALVGGLGGACVPAPLKPGGPHGVATHTWVVESTPEANPLAADGPRRVPVQAWYPSAAVEPGRVESAAAPLDGELPVLLFVHGSGSERRYHSALALHLASRGVVVLAADHPGVARKARYPDQRPVPMHPVFAEIMQQDSILTGAADPRYPQIVGLMAADVDAVLQGLPGPLAGVSLDRIALGGHSLGATVALEQCRAREQCVLWVNLDGPPLTDVEVVGGEVVFEPEGLDRPALQVSTAGYVGVVRGAEEAQAAIDAQGARIDGPSLQVHFPAAGHLDLTDLPLLLPPGLIARMLGPGSSTAADPAEPLVASNHLIEAVLDRYLRCETSADPGAVAAAASGAELRHAHDGPVPACGP